jgi:hypothetical protein
MEMPTLFEVLYGNDVWICDSGGSTHSTKHRAGFTNESEGGSEILGHVGVALQTKSTCTCNLPDQFVSKDWTRQLKATLGDVFLYNETANFNLLSLSRLLKEGWTISRGDATITKVDNSIQYHR